ncbi:MAG: P-loop NTPase [bacterium]
MASYLGAVRAHPRVVALVTLAAVAASGLLLTARSPSYEATADLLVDPLPQDDQTFRGMPLLRDTGDPVRTVQTAASLVESRAVADQAAESLGGGWTGAKVLEAVVVEPVGESNILGVTATADDPQEAARLADEFVTASLKVRERVIIDQAETEIAALDARLKALSGNEVAEADLIARRDQLQSVAATGDPTLMKSQEAVPPSAASGPSGRLVLVLALLAGFVLGCGAAMLMELAARRVRDDDDALAIYPLPVLARVPELPARKRQGPAGSTWYMPPEIREPFRTLTLQLDEPEGPRALMVMSASAGDGKTTTAVNLAVSLAASDKSVILLDFDLRKPQVGAALGLNQGPRVSDLLGLGLDLDPFLQRPPHLGPLRVLAPAGEPGDAGLIDSVGYRMPGLLAAARGLADFVIVDTAPLGEVGDALLLARDIEDLLLVVRPGNTARSQLEFVRDLLERAGRRPRGYVMLSRAERLARGYYSYGYAQPRPFGLPQRSDRRPQEVPSEAEYPVRVEREG